MTLNIRPLQVAFLTLFPLFFAFRPTFFPKAYFNCKLGE